MPNLLRQTIEMRYLWSIVSHCIVKPICKREIQKQMWFVWDANKKTNYIENDENKSFGTQILLHSIRWHRMINRHLFGASQFAIRTLTALHRCTCAQLEMNLPVIESSLIASSHTVWCVFVLMCGMSVRFRMRRPLNFSLWFAFPNTNRIWIIYATCKLWMRPNRMASSKWNFM